MPKPNTTNQKIRSLQQIIKQYISTTKSNDQTEKRVHIHNLIKNFNLPQKNKRAIGKWVDINFQKQSQQQQQQNLKKKKNKNKWKKNKIRKKLKKIQQQQQQKITTQAIQNSIQDSNNKATSFPNKETISNDTIDSILQQADNIAQNNILNNNSDVQFFF